MVKKRLGMAGLILLGILASDAHAKLAVTVTVKTTTLPGGLVRYKYTLKNLPGSTFSLESFLVTVESGADPHSPDGPKGWEFIYSDIEPGEFVAWETSLHDPDNFYPLMPGESVGFSF